MQPFSYGFLKWRSSKPEQVLIQLPQVEHFKNSFWSVSHTDYSVGWLKSGGPSDIIFAFLGLCADSEKLGIYADYPRPCALIYIQLTKALLSSRALGILSHWQEKE
jgi:hypothetical protein